jgi:hypothetical protein
MSKTIRTLVTSKFDTSEVKKRNSEAVRRFKREKSKQEQRLFKREVTFTNYIMATAKDD